jgi:signal transduction histidine kinase
MAKHLGHPLAGSIRFRLTAWYALLLVLVLGTLGLSLLTLTENRLRGELDERLFRTAVDVDAAIGANGLGLVVVDGQPRLREIRTRFDAFAARGLLVQVVDERDVVVAGSPYAPTKALVLLPPIGEEQPIFATIRLGASEVRVVRTPLRIDLPEQDKVIIGAVLVGDRLDTLAATLASLRQALVLTSGAGLALAMVGGWLLAGRALRPVDRVTAAAAAIAAREGTAASFASRLPVPSTGDEIARLATTFNAMLDRLAASFAVQQRFVADASHELRTPLTAIRGNVEVLARQIAARETGPAASDDLTAALVDIQRESARMGRLLDALLFLAREVGATSTTTSREPVRLDAIAREALSTATALATGQELTIVTTGAVTVAGDADRLRQLVLILLDNAIRHTPPGRRVTVEVSEAGEHGARLRVVDEGEGIAAEHLAHLFERFYRADGARGRATGGTGLGLAIARAIVRGHGGEITVESRPGAGSRFTVHLPSQLSPAKIPGGVAESY